MKSIRIQNLRCLGDTGPLELKPITLLVGANSSGKSTFLRTFPLIKQSLQVLRRGPLLWYGNEVDFGSFDVAKKRGTDKIWFEFIYSKIMFPYSKIALSGAVSVCFSIKGSTGRDYVDYLKLDFGKSGNVEFIFNPNNKNNQLFVNGTDYSKDSAFRLSAVDSIGILPTISFVQADKRRRLSFPYRDIISKLSSIISDVTGTLHDNKFVESLFHSKGIELHTFESVKKILDENFNNNDTNKIIFEEKHICLIRDYLLILILDDIIDAINWQIRQEFFQLSYVKPVRASAERYYRTQNLSVDELDSDGHNMAMFLSQLHKNQAKWSDFQTWTKKHFAFIVSIEETEGHVSMKICDSTDDVADNIADMGFGYSQLLPIIIMMWKASQEESQGIQRFEKTIAIEQPELHLHPLLQAKFADALVDVVKMSKASGLPFKYIIETHSKTIINRIGLRIGDGTITNNDAIVLLFEEEFHSNTNVRIANFSEKGFLTDWPLDFFDAKV